jgi:uncharacterized membrane protein YqhA
MTEQRILSQRSPGQTSLRRIEVWIETLLFAGRWLMAPGNLALMVAFVGYENFVSKLQTGDSEDRPAWMEHVDFSGLKLKLLSSIVAISAIHLLRTFLDISELPKEDVAWQLATHLGFVVSELMLACMDRLSTPPASKPDHLSAASRP